jgi:hypothetical protein
MKLIDIDSKATLVNYVTCSVVWKYKVICTNVANPEKNMF